MNDILKQIVESAPNLVCLCIDQVVNENMEGRFYHKYRTEALAFHSVSALFNAMEDFYDWIGFPQAATRQRTFSNGKRKDRKKEEAVQMTDTKDLLEHSGEKATFIIHVRYRQNATWQGEVVWAEKKEKTSFRSALELIKLIDGALDEADGEESEPALPEEREAEDAK